MYELPTILRPRPRPRRLWAYLPDVLWTLAIIAAIVLMASAIAAR